MRKQLTASFAKLAKAEGDDAVDDLDLSALAGLAGVKAAIQDVASDRAGNEMVSLGIPDSSDFFSHANTRAAEYAKDRSAELVTDIDESTRKMLRTKIAAGLEAGAMREDIIDSIMDSDIFSVARATLIADTEVAMANGAGAQAGRDEAVKAGVRLKKIWVTDSDPCPICEENADAGPIDNDEEFPSGDMAEVAHVRCLCHTESVVEDDSDDGE